MHNVPLTKILSELNAMNFFDGNNSQIIPITGFGAVISELGAAMAVGGNIQGQICILTTATELEVSKGNFDIAIALSIILGLIG